MLCPVAIGDLAILDVCCIAGGVGEDVECDGCRVGRAWVSGLKHYPIKSILLLTRVLLCDILCI